MSSSQILPTDGITTVAEFRELLLITRFFVICRAFSAQKVQFASD